VANLRNKPVDRRRLNAEDKKAYRPGGRQMALAKARQRRGRMAWNEHSEKRTVEQRPGSGGFTGGIGIQQQRMREEGQKIERSKQLRGEGEVYLKE